MKQKKILSNILVDPELTVMCKHCEKLIDQTKLIGFSLICPSCRKPQNGHPHLVNLPLASSKDTLLGFSTGIQK